jgi:hypothetical protein
MQQQRDAARAHNKREPSPSQVLETLYDINFGRRFEALLAGDSCMAFFPVVVIHVLDAGFEVETAIAVG